MSKQGPGSYKQLISWLADEGYRVKKSKRGHQVVLNSRGARVATLASTPSDFRSLRNAVSMMRRLTGLELRR